MNFTLCANFHFFLGCHANRNGMCMGKPASKQAHLAFILTLQLGWPWFDIRDTGSSHISFTAITAPCQGQHNCLGGCVETKQELI